MDISNQITRIQNKINRTNGKVYVYKVAPYKFASMTTGEMPLKHLVGVYMKNLPTYSDSIVEEDLIWAVNGMH